MADLKSEPAYGLVSIQKRNAYSGAAASCSGMPIQKRSMKQNSIKSEHEQLSDPSALRFRQDKEARRLALATRATSSPASRLSAAARL